MRTRTWLMLCLLSTFWPRPAAPAGATVVTASIDVRTVRIGDPLTVRLASGCGTDIIGVDAPEGGRVGAFELRAVRRMTAADESGCGATWALELVTLDSGSLEVPPLVVRCRAVSGTTTSLTQTNPLVVAVGAPTINRTGDIKPLKPQLAVRAGARFLLAIAAAALFLAGGAGVWLWRRRRRVVPPAPRPADVAAICREIRGLGRVAPVTDDAVRHFYGRLSTLLRQGLELRWHIPALTVSSSELLVLAATTSSKRVVPELGPLVESIDRVKFGGELPRDAECREAVHAALRVLPETE